MVAVVRTAAQPPAGKWRSAVAPGYLLLLPGPARGSRSSS